MKGYRRTIGMGLIVCVIVAGLPTAHLGAAEPALVEQEIAACKDAKARKDLEARAIATLKGNAPRAEKERACRMLKIVGTADAVPALAALLPNADLSHMARFALEAMPYPEAVAAMRQALAKTTGKTKVGVINSLGVHEDTAAVGELAPLLKSSDAAIAAAAACALGRAGTLEAAGALAEFRAKAPKDLQAVAADASLNAAERLLRRGNAKEAAAIYEELQTPNWPKHIRMGALAGLVAAQPAEAAQRLLKALAGNDPVLRGQAAQLISRMPGKETTQVFADNLLKLPPDSQTALLLALTVRKDPAARPAVLEALKSPARDVRLAAVAALGAIGSAADVPSLADLAASGDPDLAAAARLGLRSLPGEGVNEALVARMQGTGPAVRSRLLEALAVRGAKACVASVVASLEDADVSVRVAALKALVMLGGKQEIAAVLKALKKAKDGAEQGAAQDALLAIASRAGEEGLPAILAAMEGADPASRIVLLRALGRIGGPKALATVRAAIADKDEQTKDEAVRILCEWPDAAAAPLLLELARTAAKQSHQVLGLRGYVRLATQAASDDAKTKMLTEVQGLAKRPDEKRLILGACGSIPTAPALRIVMKYLDEPEINAEAATAAVSIAALLPAADKALVVEAMKKVVAQTKDAKLRRDAQKILARLK